MAASVRIEDEAFSDPRIVVLAQLYGYTHYEALGRLAYLWRYCTARGTYVVSYEIAEATIGPDAGGKLVAAELAERVDGGIRVRGTSGRIEWLAKLRANAARGGEANRLRLAKPNGNPQESHKASQADSQTLSPPIPIPTPVPTPTPVLSENHTVSKSQATRLAKRLSAKARRLGDATEAEAASARVVLDKLGAKSGVHYAGSTAHVRLIVGRLREGYSEMDLRKVIGYCAEEWSRKPEMARYLRPETLFGPTTIARYADAARAWFNTLPEEAAR